MERANPTIAAIYVNDVYVGPQRVLEDMTVGSVTEVRFIRAIDTKARWGTMCECDGGVILGRTSGPYIRDGASVLGRGVSSHAMSCSEDLPLDVARHAFLTNRSNIRRRRFGR